MTAATGVWLALFAVLAVADWVAVVRDDDRMRWVTKPGALVALIGAAIALVPFDGTVRVWMVAGLVLSLGGDVFLLLRNEKVGFPLGLVSFLLGHIAYVIGMAQAYESGALLAVGVVLVLVAMAVVGRQVVGAVHRGEHPELTGPVIAYMVVISAMVVAAFGTASPWAIVGALLFYVSDATLATNRFVRPLPQGHLAVMTTYHLGQLGLVLFLL